MFTHVRYNSPFSKIDMNKDFKIEFVFAKMDFDECNPYSQTFQFETVKPKKWIWEEQRIFSSRPQDKINQLRHLVLYLLYSQSRIFVIRSFVLLNLDNR